MFHITLGIYFSSHFFSHFSPLSLFSFDIEYVADNQRTNQLQSHEQHKNTISVHFLRFYSCISRYTFTDEKRGLRDSGGWIAYGRYVFVRVPHCSCCMEAQFSRQPFNFETNKEVLSVASNFEESSSLLRYIEYREERTRESTKRGRKRERGREKEKRRKRVSVKKRIEYTRKRFSCTKSLAKCTSSITRR